MKVWSCWWLEVGCFNNDIIDNVMLPSGRFDFFKKFVQIFPADATFFEQPQTRITPIMGLINLENANRIGLCNIMVADILQKHDLSISGGSEKDFHITFPQEAFGQEGVLTMVRDTF